MTPLQKAFLKGCNERMPENMLWFSFFLVLVDLNLCGKPVAYSAYSKLVCEMSQANAEIEAKIRSSR